MDYIRKLLAQYHEGIINNDQCRERITAHLETCPEDAADVLIDMQDRRVTTDFLSTFLNN